MRLGYEAWVRGLGTRLGYEAWVRGLGTRLGYEHEVVQTLLIDRLESGIKVVNVKANESTLI